MKYSKETVYFDVGTKARINKLHNKFRRMGVTKSQIVRTHIASKTFDESVELLNKQLGTEF